MAVVSLLVGAVGCKSPLVGAVVVCKSALVGGVGCKPPLVGAVGCKSLLVDAVVSEYRSVSANGASISENEFFGRYLTVIFSATAK